ncbi:MAG: hypothetical protein B7W99_00845 [Rhodospirillales bacterium 20-58-10]|nr:MAG: hypothetical protein B7W99_00845 [Rhodospirillales bacterium 20-58-10]
MGDNDKQDKVFFAIDFENGDADKIEAFAKLRGMTTPELIAEAMQLAFWHFGCKAGIKVITNTAEVEPQPTRPSNPALPTHKPKGPKS